MQVRFNLSKGERLSLWEKPQPDDAYLIGADVAEGVDGGDNSCAQIISRKKFKQVASWCGKIEPYEFGRVLHDLGLYYNNALVAPERNSSGVSTIDSLRKLNYPNLYKMVKFDKDGAEETDRYGWITNLHTRGLIIGTLREVIRENSLILQDPDTLSELKTFILNPDTGKMEAAVGNHDDRVMALAIAAYLHTTLPWAPESVVADSYINRIRGHQSSGEVIVQGRGGY